MTEKTKFSLYAMLSNPENRTAAEAYRFYRITAQYILVYTKDDAPETAVAVETSNIERLTAADEKWLLDCNKILLGEEMQEHAETIMQRAGDMMTILEAELERERTEIEAGEEAN